MYFEHLICSYCMKEVQINAGVLLFWMFLLVALFHRYKVEADKDLQIFRIVAMES